MNMVPEFQTSLTEYTTAKAVTRKLKSLDKPNKDEQVLRYLYWECSMSTYEIADKLGVASSRTVRHWMENHDIDRRNKVEGRLFDSHLPNPRWLC